MKLNEKAIIFDMDGTLVDNIPYHESWFALFRDDNLIDDTTFIEDVERGNFRLHPAGYRGISNGCITFTSKSHFAILREALLITPTTMVSPTLKAFGTVQVY